MASIPNNETLSFEGWASGDAAPPDPWRVLNDPGTVELSTNVASDGSNSIHLASYRNDLAETRVGVEVALDDVATIVVDAYVEASNQSWGYLTVHLDENNKLIRLDNKDSDTWYRNQTADVSDASGKHTLILRAVGDGNDAYFDNIRFLDSSDTRIDVAEVTTAEDGRKDGNVLSYGQTVRGEITTDDPKEPRWDYYHTDPWKFTAPQDSRVEVSVSGVQYVLLNGPGVDILKQQSGTVAVQGSETYTIHPITLASLPQSYSLSVTEPSTADNYRLQITGSDGGTRQGIRVRILNIPTSGLGPNNSGIVSPEQSAVDLVAAATTDADGSAVFDGTDDAGRALPLGELNAVASEYDGRMVVAAWEPDDSRPWFGTWTKGPDEILSNAWNDRRLALENQLLLDPTTGGYSDGMATVWRSVKPNGEQRQNVFISISAGKVGVGNPPSRMARLPSGVVSLAVPEDVTVLRDDVSLNFVGSQGMAEWNRAPVAGSLVVSDVYPSLPPFVSLRRSRYERYNPDRENVEGDIKSAIIGNLPVVSAIVGAGNDIIDLLNLESDSVDIDHTLGPGTDISKNEYDLISRAWSSGHYNLVHKVPVKFPDGKAKTFAAKAQWFTEDGRETDSKVELDVPLQFGPR